ncbi:MAG: hypothetical protein K2H53_01680 [Clostridia bacterium]|nr:hypothetical protein [Clostridia bacterium]
MGFGSQHLETFKTQENIIKSKLKLLDGLKDDRNSIFKFRQ